MHEVIIVAMAVERVICASSGRQMGLEEQRMQRFEAGRLSEFVGCAEHVHAVTDSFNGDTATSETLYVEQAESG